MRDSELLSNYANILNICDDAFILLDTNGVVLVLNDQARRILGSKSAVATGQSLEHFIDDKSMRSDMMDSVRLGRRSEKIIRVSAGREVLASLRPGSGASQVVLIQLCELDVFEYKRSTAIGTDANATHGFLTGNRTRPDFEVQRRLEPVLHRILSRGERAVQQGARLLLLGETGVGKTEIARFLHNSVSRSSAPFIVVNCAMFAASELTDQLFGDGERSPGLLYEAVGGTLFLDEVAELPNSVQARLVGYLENSHSGQLGVGSSISPYVRIISATNTDLAQKMNENLFRADLYYRLTVVELSVPALRQMPSLIRHLIDRFLMTINQRRSSPVLLCERFRNTLEDYSFPGNIRELLNIVQKASIFMEDAQDMEELTYDLLESTSADVSKDEFHGKTGEDLKAQVRRFERALIDKAILLHGSKRKAAKALGVDIGTISRKTSDKPAGSVLGSNEEIHSAVQLETGVNK